MANRWHLNDRLHSEGKIELGITRKGIENKHKHHSWHFSNLLCAHILNPAIPVFWSLSPWKVCDRHRNGTKKGNEDNQSLDSLVKKKETKEVGTRKIWEEYDKVVLKCVWCNELSKKNQPITIYSRPLLETGYRPTFGLIFEKSCLTQMWNNILTREGNMTIKLTYFLGLSLLCHLKKNIVVGILGGKKKPFLSQTHPLTYNVSCFYGASVKQDMHYKRLLSIY